MDDTGTTPEMRDFEAQLSAGMHALVDGEAPPPDLRERILDRLGAAPAARRRWLPVAAAAVVVVAAIGVLVGLGGDDRASLDVATDPDPGIEVAGVTDERDLVDKTRTTVTQAPTTSTSTVPEASEADGAPLEGDVAPPPAPAPEPAPSGTDSPPPTSPPTTALSCQNSTNPECGPFRWSPQPTNRPATLRLQVNGPVVVDEPVRLDLSMADPDGPVTIDCYAVSLSGPGSSLGACTTTRPECPERYGPWSPPPPEAGQASTYTNVTFHETGTHIVTVSVEPAAGCDNVDPYRSGATAEIAVEVVDG